MEPTRQHCWGSNTTLGSADHLLSWDSKIKLQFLWEYANAFYLTSWLALLYGKTTCEGKANQFLQHKYRGGAQEIHKIGRGTSAGYAIMSSIFSACSKLQGPQGLRLHMYYSPCVNTKCLRIKSQRRATGQRCKAIIIGHCVASSGTFTMGEKPHSH